MLEVKGLTKKYGSNLAVDHLNFSIEPGRIYGFLGPNGAGKSTTMNMITGYLAPSEGNVVVNGRDMLKDPIEAKKHIGYLPELPPLYEDMTVREYLDFAARLKGLKKTARDDVEEVMERTGVTDMSERLIHNLSKGYRQRVGIAQAILGYPDIIILDEPTVGLDPRQIIETRSLIKQLGEKHTVILSSHILQEISAVCDHIMIISRGRMVASDTPEQIAGSVRMNTCMNVRVLSRCDEKQLRSIGEGIKGVTGVEFEESPEKGVTASVFKLSEGLDLREEIFRAFVGAGQTILDMHSDKLSLEDVYLMLTSDSAISDAPETETAEEPEGESGGEAAADGAGSAAKAEAEAEPEAGKETEKGKEEEDAKEEVKGKEEEDAKEEAKEEDEAGAGRRQIR